MVVVPNRTWRLTSKAVKLLEPLQCVRLYCSGNFQFQQMGGRARGRICAQQSVRQDREVLDRDGLEAEVECAGLMGGIDARFDPPNELVEDRRLQGDWNGQAEVTPMLNCQKNIDHRTARCFETEASQHTKETAQ